jgi:hypothetical protein
MSNTEEITTIGIGFTNQGFPVSASITIVAPEQIADSGFPFANNTIVPSELISGSFDPDSPQSSMEFFIYDYNNQIIFSNQNYTDWSVDENTNTENNQIPTTYTNDEGIEVLNFAATASITTDFVEVDPVQDTTKRGIDRGTVYTLYNFLTNHIGSNANITFFIDEISSDRTEIRLKSNVIEDATIEFGYNRLKNQLDSNNYFDEFYINLFDNNYATGINCALDKDEENGYSVLIKLASPLPGSASNGDKCFVCVKQSETIAYQVEFIEDYSNLIDNATYIKGPNVNISLQEVVNNSTQLQSGEDLLATKSSASLDSVLNYLNRTGVNLTPNYSYNTFNEFINFSSAKERINNFYEKVSQIQAYQADINIITNVVPTNPNVTPVSTSLASLQNSITTIIENFDGYENYLYYDSSSFSYPKDLTNNTYYPYPLLATGSVEVLEWMGSDVENSQYYGGYILSASLYDENNQNWLWYTIPDYVKENAENDNYITFTNMVGQSFDEVWMYTKALSQRFNTTNNPDTGLPLGLAADAIKGLGFETFGNNYNNQNNFIGLVGEDSGSYTPPTGSELITNYVAINDGRILNYWEHGYSWEDYVEQIITKGFPYAIDKVSKEIYKRLYHNMAYLTKKKGTISGLRQLINIWGIPNTILRINEFGGKNRDNTDDYDLWYKRYSYAYTPVGNSYIASSSVKIPWMPLERNYVAENEYVVPDGVAFRFRTTGYPTSSQSGDNFTQSLAVKKSNGVNDEFMDWGIKLSYEVPPVGTYDGSSNSEYINYGKLNFYMSASVADGGVQESSDIYLPFFDRGWWTVLLQRDIHAPYNNNTKNTTYTLRVANKQVNGWDGNSLGWSGDTTLTSISQPSINDAWNKFGVTPNDGVYLGGYVSGSTIETKILNDFGRIFSGSLQEFRYYSYNISESVFNDLVMNPESIEGNTISGSQSSFDIVNFRAPLGNELEFIYTASTYDSYVENISSSHPAITGSAPTLIVTQSFVNPADSSLTSSYEFIHYESTVKRTYSKTNRETYFLDQPSIGVRNRVSNKIQVEDGEVYGNVLSQYRSIQQNYLISESYTEDITSLEVGFSPQDEVNDDIIASFGYGVISDTLADPRFAWSGSLDYYPKLRSISENYFRKYTDGSVWDYIRLIKYFDNSIFKAIKSYVPARTSVNTGVIIKQHMLERNRRVPVTVNPNTIIAYTPEEEIVVGGQPTLSGMNSPISYRNLEITGSIKVATIEGGAGGVVNPYNVLDRQIGDFNAYTQTGPGAIGASYGDTPLSVNGWNANATPNIFNVTDPNGIRGIQVAYPLRTAFTLKNTLDIQYLDVDTGFYLGVSSSIRGIIGEDLFTSASLSPTNTKVSTSEYKITPEEEIYFYLRGVTIPGLTPISSTQISYLIFELDEPTWFEDTEASSSIHNLYTSQSYIVHDETISGSVWRLQDSHDEFYNGEFSGSEFIATTQSLLNNPFALAGPLETSYAVAVTASTGQWYVDRNNNGTFLDTYPSYSLNMELKVYPWQDYDPDQMDSDIVDWTKEQVNDGENKALLVLYQDNLPAAQEKFYIYSICFPAKGAYKTGFTSVDLNDWQRYFGLTMLSTNDNRVQSQNINNVPFPPVGLAPQGIVSEDYIPMEYGPYFKFDLRDAIIDSVPQATFFASTAPDNPVFLDDPEFANLNSGVVVSSALGDTSRITRRVINSYDSFQSPAPLSDASFIQLKWDNAKTSGQRPLLIENDNGTLNSSDIAATFNTAGGQFRPTFSVMVSNFDQEFQSNPREELSSCGEGGWLYQLNEPGTGLGVGSGSLFLQGTTWSGSYGDSGNYVPYGLMLNDKSFLDDNTTIVDNTATLLNPQIEFDFTLINQLSGLPATEDFSGKPGNLFIHQKNEFAGLISLGANVTNGVGTGFLYNPLNSRYISGSAYSAVLPLLYNPSGENPTQYVSFDPQIPTFTQFYNTPFNPLINNATQSVDNTYLQVVEYDNGPIPSNIIPIIENSAVKAEVPDSFYTQKASITSRYLGSKLQSANYNYPSIPSPATQKYLPNSAENTTITYLNAFLSGSGDDGFPTVTGSDSWGGDSSYGTMKSTNTSLSTIYKAPIYFAHFKTSHYNQNNDGTYTFEIDALIESPLENVQGSKAPVMPQIIKIDGTDTWVTDVRSTFEVDRKVSVAYTNAKFGNINYSNLTFGSNTIYQGAAEFLTIGASTTGENGVTSSYVTPRSTPTMSFFNPRWGSLNERPDGTGEPVVITSNFVNALPNVLPAGDVGDFGNFLLTGSDGSNGYFILGGNKTYFSQSLEIADGSNPGYSVVFDGPGLGLINSINIAVSESKQAKKRIIGSSIQKITLGLPINEGASPFIKPPNPNDVGNYLTQNYLSSSFDGLDNGIFGYPESIDSGSLPFMFKKGDEIVCTFNTNASASSFDQFTSVTKVYTVTELSGSVGIGQIGDPINTSTLYTASICLLGSGGQCYTPVGIKGYFNTDEDAVRNIVKVYPNPSNDGVVKGQINNFIVRRRNNAGDRVIIYQEAPNNTVTSLTGSGEGYLIPGDFTPTQKRNVQSLISNLSAKNTFEKDNINKLN